MPIARDIVEKSLCGNEAVRPDVHAQVRSLASGLPGSHKVTTIVGALVSAIIDLDRDLTRGKIPKNMSADELAVELIRLAYNRWQRERRTTDRIQHQASLGESRKSPDANDLGDRWIDQFQSRQPSQKNIAQFRDVVDLLVERLTPLDVQILMMFAEGYTASEIAAKHGCHRTTISRKLDRFADTVRVITTEK